MAGTVDDEDRSPVVLALLGVANRPHRPRHHHDLQRSMKDFVPVYAKRPEIGMFVQGYFDTFGRASRLDQAVEAGEAATRRPGSTASPS